MSEPTIKSLGIKICRKCNAYIYIGDKKILMPGDIIEITELTIRACSHCETANPDDKRIMRK